MRVRPWGDRHDRNRFCAEQNVPYTETTLLRSYAIVVRYLNEVGLAARDPFACPMVQQYRVHLSRRGPPRPFPLPKGRRHDDLPQPRHLDAAAIHPEEHQPKDPVPRPSLPAAFLTAGLTGPQGALSCFDDRKRSNRKSIIDFGGLAEIRDGSMVPE
ncbi:hypothetical protein [Curtobacterium flaccumfaciens]|uniref:hypothetical protein n=1 Tax=Curtobacterium flaccumfaciens TaxID=2035 RepID=UPI0035564F69